MDSEPEMLFNQLKESGFEILVEEFSEEIITAKKLAESLRKTMPNSHQKELYLTPTKQKI